MATYTIVDKDKNPLDPGEVHAGTIQVNDGDIFIIDASVSDRIKFESASGTSTDFDIQINDSNSNDFDIEINDDLNADITIADDVDISDIDIKAHDAESVNLTAGDNVSLGEYEGSRDGSDTIVIGDGFTTTKDIKTEGGDDSITIGNGASVETIELGDGNNTLSIGDDLIAHDIKSGDGADEISIGSGADLHNIDTGKGDDTITIGDNLVVNDITTGDGNDNLTIGDGAIVDDIDTGKGNDNLVLGDDFTGDKVETKDGDDNVIVGTNATIDKIDGGNDNDTLRTSTPLPDATNFETTICFADDTYIRTERGDVAVEMLVVGDKVATMDHGLQPIRWIGGSFVKGTGPLAPVRIAKGALGNSRNLWVSQQHRILINDWRAELYFGEPQVFVPAKHLVNGDSIKIVERTWVGYFHMIFDRHEIVFSEGIASESFYPGEIGLQTLSDQAQREIDRLFPKLLGNPNSFGPSARLSLCAYEGRLLAAECIQRRDDIAAEPKTDADTVLHPAFGQDRQRVKLVG